MSRAFFYPGLVFVTVALVLSILVAISLPFLTAMDIVRVHFETPPSTSDSPAIGQLRFGIWAYCVDNASTAARTCIRDGHGYAVTLRSTEGGDGTVIGSSWTRGLAVHPVATAFTFLAFALAFSRHMTVTLIASLVAFLAALLTLIAFAIDIALLAKVRNEMGDFVDVVSDTDPGPGFWLTFVSLLLLLLTGCTVCFGRRRQRMSNANSYEMSTKRPFWKFWRR